MYFFMDNSEFTRRYLGVLFPTDYFVLGGYLASTREMKTIEDGVKEIKENYEIPVNLPIKWNLKDIRKIYQSSEKLDIYKKIMDYSDEIRLSMVSLLNRINCKLIMSAKPAYKKEFRRKAYEWAFINILQRLGYAAYEEIQSADYPSISIIMDWPEAQDRSFFRTYSNAYYLGEPNFDCGDLKALNFNVNLAVSTTINSPHLQLADICVGITKEFIRWSYEEKNVEKVKKFFPPLVPFFRKGPRDKITRYGLIVNTEDYPLIEKKIKEIQEIAEDEIPF